MSEDPTDYDFELLRWENGTWVRVAEYSGGCSFGDVLKIILVAKLCIVSIQIYLIKNHYLVF